VGYHSLLMASRATQELPQLSPRACLCTVTSYCNLLIKHRGNFLTPNILWVRHSGGSSGCMTELAEIFNEGHIDARSSLRIF